jgi:hypothetical protein
MPSRYPKDCPDCLDKELEIAALVTERDAARHNAVRWETECHNLRRELQALRMSKDTERIYRER